MGKRIAHRGSIQGEKEEKRGSFRRKKLSSSFSLSRDLVSYGVHINEDKMCLGIPVKVIEVADSKIGKVDNQGTQISASFELLNDVRVGDWVILHAGFAISKLNEEEAQETLQLFREILEAEEQVQE